MISANSTPVSMRFPCSGQLFQVLYLDGYRIEIIEGGR